MSISESTYLKNAIKLAKKTRKLDLSHLNLTSIPEEVYKLSNLEELELNNNKISGISSAIRGLVSLKRLELSYNRLTHVPKQLALLENLKEVNLSSNSIAVLPGALWGLPWSSGRVNISNNPLHPALAKAWESGYNKVVDYLASREEVENRQEEEAEQQKVADRELFIKQRSQENQIKRIERRYKQRGVGLERLNQRALKATNENVA